MDQPLFDHYLFLALREVARGEIRMHAVTGDLRRHGTTVQARVADALADLQRDGYLRARVTEAHPWVLLEPTPPGARLLAEWLSFGCREGRLSDTRRPEEALRDTPSSAA